MGTLFIIATPIGNLEDISIRALRTLYKVDAIACEDTRRTGTLLKLLEEKYSFILEVKRSRPELISYYEQNEFERIPQVITALKNGLNVALVSDAGTPAISDPGFKLIRECINENISVESIPGPSAVISALVVSGLPTDKFLFLGYPPRKPGHRKSFIAKIKQLTEIVSPTLILFESPHKLKTTLLDLQLTLGDLEIVLCRELTKVYESKRREKISDALSHYEKTDPKGEYVILFHL